MRHATLIGAFCVLETMNANITKTLRVGRHRQIAVSLVSERDTRHGAISFQIGMGDDEFFPIGVYYNDSTGEKKGEISVTTNVRFADLVVFDDFPGEELKLHFEMAGGTGALTARCWQK